MKKIFTIPMILLAAALCLTACSLTGPCVPGDGKVTASLEAMTRTQLLPEGNLYQVLWRTGDRIAVTDSSVTAHYTAESGGAATATFAPEGTPTLSSGPYTAWYPAALADGILPAIQTYQAGGVADVPMCATSDDLTFGFCNLGGFIRLDVTTALTGIKIDRIVLKADQGLSGQFFRSGNLAVVPGSDGVRLDCGGVALGTNPVSFYISVPANTYTGLTITLYTPDGKSQQIRLKEDATYSVKRSEVCEISLVAGDFETNHFEPAYLRPGNDFNHTIKLLSGTKRGVTTGDSVVKRVVFETGSKVTEGLRVDSYDSPWPIYMNWSRADSTITVSTAAGSFRSNRVCCYMFSYLYMLEEIVNFKSLDTTPAEDLGNMFIYAGSRAPRLVFDISAMRTPNVTVFYRMFQHCESIESLDLSNFETSSVVNMDNMFAHCYRLKTVNLSSFDTRNVATFRSFFNRCDAIEELDLDNFNTDKGVLMSYMFYGMASLRKLSIRGMDVNRSATNITYFLQKCPNLTELNVGDGFRKPDNSIPTNFFTINSETKGVRTASNPGTLTIRCTQNSADWLARTNLRWVHSGYKSATPVTVNFVDDATGNPLSVTWAAN